MNTRNLIWLVLVPAITVMAAGEDGTQQERLVLDPTSGDYIVSYRGTFPPHDLETIRFIPATKIDPSVTSKFKTTNKGTIGYRYKIRNGKQSRQPLITFVFDTSQAEIQNQLTPKGWDASIVKNLGNNNGFIVGWSYQNLREDGTAGLLPSHHQSGFSVESLDLPGINVMRIRGATSAEGGYPDEGPDPASDVGKQLKTLEMNDFVVRPAAVPLIPAPNPFDAAAVLTSMQKHVNQDLVSMKLIDPAFASQLDRLFQTAIAAAKGGNTVALKGNLKDLRLMLKQEHADMDKDDEDWDKDDDGKNKEKDKSRLIDKLAAKVLDFDFRYVEKQIKSKKDD